MNASSDILRRSLIVGSAISLLVAIASVMGLAASFIKPTLDLHSLYRMSSLTRTAGFCFLGGYLVAGFAFPNEAAASVKTSSLEPRILKIIFAACLLVTVFSPHTYVYPEAIGWVTKSKAGTFSVSSDVAREYLWRAVRISSAILLCTSLSVIAFARKFSL